MKTLTIKVPNWFPTTSDVQRYKWKLKMWMFPPRCSDCNTRVKSSNFYWKQHRSGTHPLGYKNSISDFALRVSFPSCAACMKKQLHQLPKNIGYCTLCEVKNVPVLGYFFDKETKQFFTFLWHYWNGSTFCTKCVDELLDNGQPATGVYRMIYKKGKLIRIPEYY